jgi:histidyl-tRNA synthetase
LVSSSPYIYENHNVTHLVAELSQHMSQYGYLASQVPAIADVNIFLTKAGDQVIERLFTFERFGNQLALRPEFTALAAHRYATSFPDGNHVARWQFNGSVFIESSNQTDYQQMSVGAELIGTNSLLADSEIIIMAIRGLRDVLNIEDLTLSVGHTDLLRQALQQFDLDQFTEYFLLDQVNQYTDIGAHSDQIMAAYDQHIGEMYTDIGSTPSQQPATPSTDNGTQQMLDTMLDATRIGETMGGRTRQDIVNRMARKVSRALHRDRVFEALEFLDAWSKITSFTSLQQLAPATTPAYQQTVDQFEKLLAVLDSAGIAQSMLEVSPTLVRDWNYYTGVVFQFQHASGTIFGGGGRYDELVQLMGANKSIPAIGFAYYIEDILPHYQAPRVHHRPLSIYLTPDGTDPGYTIQWAEALRKLGATIIVNNTNIGPAQTLSVTTDGTVIHGEQTFTLNHADQLLSSIKEKSGD